LKFYGEFMTTTEPELTIAEMAAETGLTTSTLRYYEQEGLLLQAPGRAPSSHRRYPSSAINWLIFVTRLRSTGMPVRDIRRYAALARQGEHTTSERLQLLIEHRARVRAQLEQLQHSLSAIDYKIASYERFTTR
jgi:DNA-binding transcriptional MerR regulator